MGLDHLYRPGAAVGFAERTDLTALFSGARAQVTESESGTDLVRVETTWADSSHADYTIAICRIDFRALRAHYLDLIVAPAYAGKGIYRTLILQYQDWYEALGFQILTAAPSSPRAQYLLALGGFHCQEWDGDAWFAMKLGVPDRVAEYAAWLRDGRKSNSEPAWHRELREHEVPGGELY
jgi:GNAT superfamily N-acetyltransferase